MRRLQERARENIFFLDLLNSGKASRSRSDRKPELGNRAGLARSQRNHKRVATHPWRIDLKCSDF